MSIGTGITAIGAIVGVFIALLVGLSLFGEVSNQVVKLIEHEAEGYEVDGYYHLNFLNEQRCTRRPRVIVESLTSGGGIESVTFLSGSGCGSLTGQYDAGNLEVDGLWSPNATRGEGAVFTVTLSGGRATGAVIKANGGERVTGSSTRGYIGYDLLMLMLPTIVLLGLLSVGGVVGGLIARSVESKFL